MACQLDGAARGRVSAGSEVIVCETRDGELRVIHVIWLHGGPLDPGRAAFGYMAPA